MPGCFGKSWCIKNKKTRNNNSTSNCHVEGSLNTSLSSVTICNSGSIPELSINNKKLLEERLKRYEDEVRPINCISTLIGRIPFLRKNRKNETGQTSSTSSIIDRVTYLRKNRENEVSKAIINIEDSMNVDLCFVLDCTFSMECHIKAAKEHILKVANYVNSYNSNIKFWIGFCGYRDHRDKERLQIFDFTNSLEKFKKYITTKVVANGGDDLQEDVLGGLNAAITKMTWSNATCVLIHIGDAPPHGRRYYTFAYDNYPEGDPKGLTAESVLKKMQSKNILYHFGEINDTTNIMLKVFRENIGEFPVFDLKTMGNNPEILIKKFFEATCSAIFSSITLTTTLRNSKNIYSLQRKKLQINPHEPDWTTIPEKTGELLSYIPPKTLTKVKDEFYFINSGFTVQNITFKFATEPFSVGAERYAYFGLDTTLEHANKLVIKKYHDVKTGTIERYLESVEISSVAYFLSTEFNKATKRVGVNKKVTFIDVKVLYDKTDNTYYSVEKYFSDAKFKRFNVNSGLITEFHSILEAFAHFTYQYTEGYLVVYDLQGVDLSNEFLLTDPAIHCVDLLRFGITNLGKRGIQRCILANHKCNSICKKLKLKKVNSE
ncbi:kinase-like protein [Gigaspora margarita]|uniref:Kinase-like protein n=1 Tax=Gigaspora margarita TaxID=4874 RepID=A0A8H3X1K3_GIGMA|nr:kinase-like protein [Gigaspora margarita]